MELDSKPTLSNQPNPANNFQNTVSRNKFLDKFTQLWFACYFERRLTRQKVEQADLITIVNDLMRYFSTIEQTGQEKKRIDFRRAIPLLQGLHVLFSKKLQYLVKDSE